MTRDVLETVVWEGVPFVIKISDAERLKVHATARIVAGRSRVVGMTDHDLPRVLPMPGFRYLPKENGSAA